MDADKLYTVIGRQAVVLMERNGEIEMLRERVMTLQGELEAKDGCACEPEGTEVEFPNGD